LSDLSFILNEAAFADLPAWRDVCETFQKGAVPHSWAVRAPSAWHGALLAAMSRFFMCDAGNGDDMCGGCRSWSRDGRGEASHPDVIVAGEFDKACNIEACRGLIKELSLKPVAAKRRLGVLLAADKLLPAAANSLLKIAEEPPSHACLLFIMEGGDFLPTLRSRSRFTVLAAPLSSEARSMPRGEEQWAGWLGNFKDDEDVPELLSSWTADFLRTGDVECAARADKLRLLVAQKKLSQTMVCDLLTLTLKEELPFEPIFGGFR
jgi:DNA polymerase-3 subunit delta'